LLSYTCSKFRKSYTPPAAWIRVKFLSDSWAMTSKLERSLQMSSVVMRAAAPEIVSLPQEICHLIFLTSSPQ
jgi:hypothetical protein